MYDTLSADYDRFVNWQARLSFELPFIIQQLKTANARTILDAASGTGMHAIALAQCGFTSFGADLSQGMIAKAIKNAMTAGVQVGFEATGFGSFARVFGEHSFDALLCLGNSLPHLLSSSDLSVALIDFAASLRPGGLLIIQNRNFDAVMSKHERWMEPQSHTESDTQWVFLRFYDFDPDGLLTFNMVTLKRVGSGEWSQTITTSRLRPLLKHELVSCLAGAGFTDITCSGNMNGAAFDSVSSSNLVVIARSAMATQG